MSTNGCLNGTYGTMYYVQDMAKAVSFYKDKLQLKPSYESEGWTEFDLGGHSLCLHGMDKHDTGKSPSQSGGVLITQVKNIRELVSQLKANGLEFTREVSEIHPGAFCTEFVDPSGNVISLYEDTSKT